MIRKLLPKIRKFFEPPDAKVFVRNPRTQEEGQLGTINRFEPVIPEKHFGYGLNLVAVELDCGGHCRIVVEQE